MINRWKLNIRNFGKVSEAVIEVSPFMIFVGKNNSGKSYTMILLWGLLNEARVLINNHLESHPKYPELLLQVVELVKEIKNTKAVLLEEEFQKRLLEMFNQILANQKDNLLKKLFRYPIQLDKLWIERDQYLPFAMTVEESEEDNLIRIEKEEIERPTPRVTLNWGQDELFDAYFYDADPEKLASFLLKYALTSLVCHGYNDNFSYANYQLYQPLYFPASRTGFMHTYRAIVGNIFESTVSEHLVIDDRERKSAIVGTELTLPTTLFLSKLQKQNVDQLQREKYKDELEFLFKNIIKGTVVKDELGEFKFNPENSNANLPLHVTSSLVAEIAPLSIFLASNYDPQLWIIEELESHLHSEMQLEITRMLFRLVNKGKAIWLTTHSDNLAQQINNLLTLSTHNQKEAIMKKLNYEQVDLLCDPTISTAYQFEQIDGGTVVEQLELGEFGFVMRTFNDTLGRLIEETDIIQNFPEE